MKTKFILLLILVTCVLVTSNAMAEDPQLLEYFFLFKYNQAPVIQAVYEGEDPGSAIEGLASYGVDSVGVFGKTYWEAGVRGGFGWEILEEVYGALSEMQKFVTEEEDLYRISAVHGYIPHIEGWPTQWPTIGVLGENYQPGGYAVKGVSGDPTSCTGYFENLSGGNALGVIGNARITGNLIVAGNLTVTGAIPELENLALLATANASSEHPDIGEFNYAAKNINDETYGLWDIGEWASYNETGAIPATENTPAKDGPWIQLNWTEAQTFNLVRIWSRPNKYDQILDSYLILVYSSESGKPQLKKHLGMIPAGGLCKEVPLTGDEGKDVIALQVYITEVVPETKNTGLAEIQCFYKQ